MKRVIGTIVIVFALTVGTTVFAAEASMGTGAMCLSHAAVCEGVRTCAFVDANRDGVCDYCNNQCIHNENCQRNGCMVSGGHHSEWHGYRQHH